MKVFFKNKYIVWLFIPILLLYAYFIRPHESYALFSALSRLLAGLFLVMGGVYCLLRVMEKYMGRIEKRIVDFYIVISFSFLLVFLSSGLQNAGIFDFLSEVTLLGHIFNSVGLVIAILFFVAQIVALFFCIIKLLVLANKGEI